MRRTIPGFTLVFSLSELYSGTRPQDPWHQTSQDHPEAQTPVTPYSPIFGWDPAHHAMDSRNALQTPGPTHRLSIMACCIMRSPGFKQRSASRTSEAKGILSHPPAHRYRICFWDHGPHAINIAEYYAAASNIVPHHEFIEAMFTTSWQIGLPRRALCFTRVVSEAQGQTASEQLRGRVRYSVCSVLPSK